MSQVTFSMPAATTTLSLSVNGSSGAGYINMTPQVTPPMTPSIGYNMYSNGNNNLSWKDASARVFTFDTTAVTASRTWSLPDSSSELATIDMLGFSPKVVSVLYATTTVGTGVSAQVQGLTITPPSSFASLPGFSPIASSDLGVDLTTGDFSMDTVGTVYEFKIDTVWPIGADTGERRIVSLDPLNGDLVSDQVFVREELGLITSSHKQTISCDSFVHVYASGGSGGFNATVNLESPNALADRIVDTRIRVIRWS